MDTLLQDVRYGVRTLFKSSTFTAIALLTLALGIGANTAIFSIVYGVLLRPLPYPEPERIVQLAWDYGQSQSYLSDRQYRFFAENMKSYQHMAAVARASFTLLGGDQPDRVSGLHVTPGYFDVLGVKPSMGRGFLPRDDAGTGERVAVLSHHLWQRRFASQSDAVGRTIRLNGEPYTVIGVTPAGFEAVPAADLWVPLAPVAKLIGQGTNYAVVARLRPDVTQAQAQAEAKVVLSAYRKAVEASGFQNMGRAELGVFSFPSLIVSDVATPLVVLFGAVGLVLLIACANVANLLLARTTARGREISIRLAMGASRGRIFRQLATEGLLLSLAGAGLGLLIANWSMDALLALHPGTLVRQGDVRLDAPVLVFAFLLSVVTGILFSTAPALGATRTDMNASLKEGTGRSTTGVRRGRLRSALVVSEVAISLLLLVGASLLIRTLANLRGTNAGFDPSQVYALQVWLAGSEAKSGQQITLVSRSVVERLRALPGVTSAAIVASGLPLQRGGNIGMRIDGQSDDDAFSADFRIITPDYFETLGVPLLSGRIFTEADAETAPRVIIINEAMARRRFPDANPIGQRVWVSNEVREIVGVVGNVRSFVGYRPPPSVFLPIAQTPVVATRLFEGWFPSHVLVRTSGDPQQLAEPVERTVREAAPQVPTGRGRSMVQVLAVSLANQRFEVTLMTAFAGLAMLLAAVGLYGVISQTTVERTHEIGVRMALGAHPADILRMILGQGMRLVTLGLVLGLAGAFASAKVLENLLYGVTARDPLSYVAAVPVLVVAALASCYFPARRATRVDPMVALRYE